MISAMRDNELRFLGLNRLSTFALPPYSSRNNALIQRQAQRESKERAFLDAIQAARSQLTETQSDNMRNQISDQLQTFVEDYK